jgi:hypothetical protein
MVTKHFEYGVMLWLEREEANGPLKRYDGSKNIRRIAVVGERSWRRKGICSVDIPRDIFEQQMQKEKKLLHNTRSHRPLPLSASNPIPHAQTSSRYLSS